MGVVAALLAIALPTTSANAQSSGGWGSHAPEPSSHPNLAPALERASSGRPQSAGTEADGDGRIVVQVNGPSNAELHAAVEAAGGTVRNDAAGFVLAWVAPSRLGALSEDARVDSVTEARRLQPDATSQGVSQSGASVWQGAGRDGSGVKVGIVDVGFTNYTLQQPLNVPIPAGQKNLCGAAGMDGSTDHGTAVTEIVHQMAPAASLYLVCVQFDTDIAAAEQYLAGQGVTIVNASITSNLSGRGDGSGVVGQAVAAGRAAGQLWSAAAGNDGNRHFNFVGTDRENDGAVEYVGGVFPPPGPDESEIINFTLGSGDTINIQSKYDAWPVTNQEFGVCIWVAAPAPAFVGAFLGCQSGGQQTGSPKPPITGFFASGVAAGNYAMAILRVGNTTIAPRFDVYFEGNESAISRLTAGGSIGDPASSPSALAVGAYQQGTAALESFSSQGPTIDGRRKPDIAATDGVSNDVYNPFFGTSAAAPHVTGAAAIVKQLDPSLTPAQIQQFLQGRAIDAGAAGPDNQFGSGRLALGALAAGAGGPNPVLSVDPITPFPGGIAVSGYAVDPDSSVPSAVDIAIDGGAPKRIAAAGARNEPASLPSAGASHGFAMTFPLPPGTHTVCVTAINAPTTAGSNSGPTCRTGSALVARAARKRDTDFTGDQVADVAVVRPGSPAMQWFASGLPNQPFKWGDSGLGDLAVPADYNGDGRSEPAVIRPGSPMRWFISPSGNPVAFGDSTLGDIPVVGDYNGDGYADMAVWRPGSPSRLFVNGIPGSTAFGEASLGDIPVPADYNGDGRTDFAIYRQTSPGQWWINGLPSPTIFGEPGDVPLPADYNGDGRADIAVMRLAGTAEQWFVTGVGTFLFGSAPLGDIPVPADYTGDGRVDITVVRPGTPYRWFINGGSSPLWGQTPDIPTSGR
ncbi:MAG: hypothetical protein QOD92_1459 [Acidimicrobiaceae bacterium]|jgi:subtilisin family serine protease